MNPDSTVTGETRENEDEHAAFFLAEPVEDVLTERIIGGAIEVHKHLGPGLLESAYEECLCHELTLLGLRFRRQVNLPVNYKGLKLDCAYKLDVVVEDSIILELKAVEDLVAIHKAQLLTYLRAANKRVGLLINFNVPILKNGLRRMVNHYMGPTPNPQSVIARAVKQGKGSDSLSSSLRFPPSLGVSAVK